MASQEEKEYRVKLELLKANFGEQAKELSIPVALDLVSMLAGWYIGKKIGRASLLAGIAAYGFGKVHSLHETINREEQRGKGYYNEENRPVLSGFNPLYKNEDRIYHGESPAVAFGFGLMLGGAFSENTMNGLGEGEKTADPFLEIANDLKHRLYLDKFFGDQKAIENKGTEKSISGLDEIDIFMAGDKSKELDFSKLDEIDKQNENHAIKFENQKPGLKSMGGNEDDLGEISSDRIL